jgi:hypothetical protein
MIDFIILGLIVCDQEATISINHNWVNGCNVHICWRHLVAALGDVQAEIADCRDMDGWGQQCQVRNVAEVEFKGRGELIRYQTVLKNGSHSDGLIFLPN